MKKSRAVAAAIVGLALSATAAFAASHQRTQPSTDLVVHEDPSEDPTESLDPSESPEAPDSDADAEDAGNAGDNHGTDVRAVAQDKDAVGGKNDNHGGAVSEAARDNHGHDATRTRGKSAEHRSK